MSAQGETREEFHQRGNYELTEGLAHSERINRMMLEELEDNDRWLRQILTDFRIPFDDHKHGRRIALNRWMIEQIPVNSATDCGGNPL